MVVTMAAASIASHAAATSIQAADSSQSLSSSRSPNSLLLQRKTRKEFSVTCVRPVRALRLGNGPSHYNFVAARSRFLTGPLVRVLSDHAVASEERDAGANAETAAIGVDEEASKVAEADADTAAVAVDEEVLKQGEALVGRDHENSDGLSLSNHQPSFEAHDLSQQLSNGAATLNEVNADAAPEGNGTADYRSNGSAHVGTNEAMSISYNGEAAYGSNGAAHAERDVANCEGTEDIRDVLERDESGLKNDDTEVGRVTSSDAEALGTMKSEVGSPDPQVQFGREEQPDTALLPYSVSRNSELDGEKSAKDKVESIGQEDPWFKQAGQVKTPVSVAAGGRWNQFKTYSTIQRTCEIWFFVATFVFKAWLINKKFTYKGGITDEKKKEKRKVLAQWLKEGLLRLGPTFIKIGQQFSTRVDILPQEFVDQLSELQDQVPPFDSETALKIVEEDLGAPVGEIFDQFDPDPIAAASLGQVHRAVLKKEEVVVKVQRPGLKDLFDIDLKNLRVIAENLQKLDPKSDGAKRDWVAIYDECASVLYQEIDYCKEGANAERFAANFKDLEYVRVPKVYWECTTTQVLTMEYVPGIKINRISALDQLGVDRKKLAQYAVESYLEQILRHGFFHADPHPGNIAVDDENGGRLIFYDFGMMGSISANVREGLLEAFYGVYEKDPDKVLQAMVQMGVLVPTGDMTAVRRTAQFFLNSFEDRLAAQRGEREAAKTELGFKKRLTKEERIEKKKLRLAAIGEDLLSISVDQPFRFPATFTFVVRAFSVLDGIGKGLDPRFDISEIAKPYALEILKFREFGYDVLMRDIKKRWKRQAQAFSNLFRQADRVEKLAEVIQRLEQGDLKLRVRTLETERAFKRMFTMQQTIGQAVLAGLLLNLATILQLHAVRIPAIAAFVGSAMVGFNVLIGLLKAKKLDKQEKLISGTA